MMSSPTLRHYVALGVAVVGGLGVGSAAATPAIQTAPPAPAPSALRTERVLDREALSALGIARPTRLAYDDEGCLYVLDAQSRKVVKLDPSGRLLHDLGGYGDDEASFSLPSDLAVDRRQTLLVLDRGRGSLMAFDRSGAFLAGRSFPEDVAREAFAPGARVLIDGMGDLWLLAERERDLIPLNDQLDRARSSRFLTSEESLTDPTAAAFLPRGGVWVYDAEPGALRHFTSSGQILGSVALSDSGRAPGSVDLACDGAGYLYAADATGERILVFDTDGTLRLTRFLGGQSEPWRPTAVAVSRLDRVAIADPEREEIQILAIVRERAP